MRKILIVSIFLGILLTLGCQQQDSPPFRIGTNVWPGYEPFYLAQELDYYASVDVRFVEYPSASEVIRAFKNENLEAAALTLDEAIYLHQTNPDIMVVLVTDISHGGDVIIAKKPIASMKELRGKRVAVESSALGAYVVTRALEIHQMQLTDISVVHLEVSAHENAFLANQVDAAVTFEPVRTKLLSAGGNEIFSSREIPNEIVDVLVVHKQALKHQRKVIQQIITGWFKALNTMRDDPEGSSAIIAKRLKLSSQEVLESYDGLILPSINDNRLLLSTGVESLSKNIKNLSRVMLQNGLLEEAPPPSSLFTDDLLLE